MKKQTSTSEILANKDYNEARAYIQLCQDSLKSLGEDDLFWLQNEINQYFHSFVEQNPKIYSYLRSNHLSLLSQISNQNSTQHVIMD